MTELLNTLLLLAILLVVALVLRVADRVLKLCGEHEDRLARLENGGPLPPPLLTHVPPQRAGEGATAVLPVVPIESPREDERYLP